MDPNVLNMAQNCQNTIRKSQIQLAGLTGSIPNSVMGSVPNSSMGSVPNSSMGSVPNVHTPCCSAPNPIRNNSLRIQIPMNGTPQPPFVSSGTPQPVTPHSLSFRHGTPQAYLFPATPSAPPPYGTPLPPLTPRTPSTPHAHLAPFATPQ